jgi:site-specific recombinase XerD
MERKNPQSTGLLDLSVVPIGERAMYWVPSYLDRGRPELLMPPDDQVLFLTRWGEGFTLCALTNLVRDSASPK